MKETCNAALVASRRGTIDKVAFDKAIDAALRLSSTNVKFFSQEKLMRNAVSLASESRLTVYDALYVSLAQTLKAPLLSLDSGQAQVAKRLGLRVIRG